MYAVGVDVSCGWSTVAVLRSKTDKTACKRVAIKSFMLLTS